ncbi:hypothetical protein VTO73DRAFT_7002 [Trametes versicolor]
MSSSIGPLFSDHDGPGEVPLSVTCNLGQVRASPFAQYQKGASAELMDAFRRSDKKQILAHIRTSIEREPSQRLRYTTYLAQTRHVCDDATFPLRRDLQA